MARERQSSSTSAEVLGYNGRVIVDPGPGAQPFSEELSAQLARAVAGRRAFRTQHLRDDGTPRFTNRLALETSPYLLPSRRRAHEACRSFSASGTRPATGAT